MEIFNGSVTQNIARMKVEFCREMVEDAAKQAGALEMISRLRQGHETDVWTGGLIHLVDKDKWLHLQEFFLVSQKYPKVLVLDEPKANLDESGEIS